MTAPSDDQLGFAPDDDAPIPYMARTRDYYAAIGYDHALSLGALCRRAVPAAEEAAGAVPRRASSPPRRPSTPPRATRAPARTTMAAPNSTRSMTATPRRRTTCGFRTLPMIACTPSADDSGTWFPLPQLHRLAREGRIGEVAPRFFGAPTNRSHRVTLETDAPEILARCRDDGVDAAVLVPNCPVCHQTISLVARASGGQRHRHRGDGLRQGHRRARRRAAVSVFRFSARQFRRQAARCRSRRPSRWSWRCACWKPRRARGPRCSRRCAGARMPPGSATTAMPAVERRRSWRGCGANSTRRRRSRADCARARP